MKIKGNKLFRNIELSRECVSEENRTVNLSFSSEEPYERWFGVEILDHRSDSVRLDRIKNTGPLLMDHDTRDQVGVVESVDLSDRRGRAVVRFGKSERANEIFNDVLDGIRTSVSVGYKVHKMVLEEENDDSPNVYRVSDWEPLEVSLVSVPADSTVGVGRTDEETEIEVIKPKVKNMKTDNIVPDKPNHNEPPKVNIKEIESNARKSELDRIRDIHAVGDMTNHKELANEFINSGQSVDAFRKIVLERMGDDAPLKPVVDNAADIGLSDREAKSYSFVRMINAQANPGDRRAQEAAKFELECSDAEAERSGKEPQGKYVPNDILRRDLNVTTDTAGGHTVATDLLSGSFIDKLENAMVLKSLGITTMSGLAGNIAIPRQTTGATAFWVAESTAVTESQQVFDQVTMSPNTLGAFTDASRKLLLQSSIDVESFIRNDLALRLALEIDRVGINGSGSGAEPEGILNATGIGDVAGGTNGLAPTWAHIIELETDVANANAALGSLGYLTNTKFRGKTKTTEKFSGTNGNPIYAEGNTPLNGYKSGISNQVPSNLVKGSSGAVCSAAIFGNFADLIVGMWGGLDLLVDPYTGGTAGTVRVIVMQDIDVALRHVESFSAMQDALTA